jgi:diadenosine tetraphosphate (Ap4A) HIT family hydrolase
MFTLDPKLAADTLFLGQLRLSQVLLMNNQDFPWLILVPQLEGIIEWTDLTAEDRYQLMDEITLVSDILRESFKVDKLNIASLGNIVSQCHVHVVGRRHEDAAWPAPVWGRNSTPYADPQPIVAKLQALLSDA